MKIIVREETEWSDDQRETLAALLDGPDARVRKATRDECKMFAWSCGARWAEALASGQPHLQAVPGPYSDEEEPEDPEAAEDLLGAPDPLPVVDGSDLL